MHFAKVQEYLHKGSDMAQSRECLEQRSMAVLAITQVFLLAAHWEQDGMVQ